MDVPLFPDKKYAILEEWRLQILKTYPRETAEFLRREKDRFANPVGCTLLRTTEILLEALLRGDESDNEEVHNALDDLIKIRAVQDFSASQVLEFIMALKHIVRGQFHGEYPDPDQLRDFESRIDHLVLAAFDIYAQNRERIFNVRINEIKNRFRRLFERADLLSAESGAQTPADDEAGTGSP